ncbi:MAG TPA: hypothetical protein VF598_14055 [Hymenobacter sp.]
MKKMPAAAGQRQVLPRKPAKNVSRSLLIEHLGSEEGWALLSYDGTKLNPPIITAQAFALYIRRHGHGKFIENLEALDNSALQQIALQKSP